MATQASDSVKQRSRATSADELAVVVQRAQAFTSASGAAIAISEGNKDEIVCKARSGSSAPDVGAVLRVEGSFTGICIQTGKELRCDDAETDTRVDTAAIRALGIRSMVITPIKDEGKAVGVLAVFAPTPHAFTITHVAVLKTMADQIAALLQKERRAKDEPQVAAPIPVPKPAAKPAPLPQPPVVIRPSAAQPMAASVAAAPARAAAPSPATVESLRPIPIAVEIAPPAPPSRKEEKRDRRRSEHRSEAKVSLGTLDAVAGEPKKPVSKFLVIGVAVAAIAAGTTWAVLKMHKSSASTAQTAQPQQQNPPAPAQTASATTPNAAVTTPAPAPAPSVSTPANTKSNPPAEKQDSKKNEQKNQQPSKPTPAAPVTVELAGGGPSKIGNKQDQAPDVAPTLAVGGGNSTELTSVVRSAGRPVPSMLAQSDLVNAKAIRTAPAAYPDIARARRLSGIEVMRITVGKDGKVSNVKYVSGPVIFKDAATEALRQWVFQPATLNGQAIEQETEIRMTFKPN